MVRHVCAHSGDAGLRGPEEDGPPCLREKRAANQEAYHLEAYDCNEPENVVVYPIPQQYPETKESTSLLRLSGTT